MLTTPSLSLPVSQVRSGFLSALILSVGLASALVVGTVYTYLRKDITVVVSGQAVLRTTFKSTVGQALAEAAITLKPTDEVTPPVSARLAEGARVVVRRAVPVSIMIDGKTFQVESAAATVGDLLARRRVAIGPFDKVYPSLDVPLTAGTRIRVVRIEHKVVTEQITIPFTVYSSQDPATPRGMVRVKAPGRVGLKEWLFKVTFADGVQVQRQLVGERVVHTPLDRIITIGTLVQIAARGAFAGKEFMDMIATAYSPFCCPGVDNITALGLKAGYGVVAVDPAIIPLGSKLFIEGYGAAVAGDTGGMIKGLRIDLGFETKREAIRFGRRPVRVYIVEKTIH